MLHRLLIAAYTSGLHYLMTSYLKQAAAALASGGYYKWAVLIKDASWPYWRGPSTPSHRLIAAITKRLF
jgi:hypothetical protein